jgi:hypothetical protein
MSLGTNLKDKNVEQISENLKMLDLCYNSIDVIDYISSISILKEKFI